MNITLLFIVGVFVIAASMSVAAFVYFISVWWPK